uniref:DUF3344 domain-containing protein n=1 Tax=Candidatus Methanophaga sp. ANME-1 ERB7 TaxID=2759913 RepID=A0A7G9ZDD3_9EURY|nr:hypothetical protein BFNMBJLP_00001 [Methanosarcinales archaeon ANME-1 ERB7]
METGTNGSINGGVFIGYEPWNGTTTLTSNFEVPNGTVKWARLYTGIWAGRETHEGWVNVTFNGHELNTSMVDSNTFELNTWDVTDYVNLSGNNAWYTRLDDDCDDRYVSVTNAILVLGRRAVSMSDLTITAIKPYHYAWSEEQGIPEGEPWFNLMNYVNITVKNFGTEVVDNFAVTLYADDELIGSETCVNVTDVTSYLNASDNVVTQGDDGDCMMPSNAFLMISYEDGN